MAIPKKYVTADSAETSLKVDEKKTHDEMTVVGKTPEVNSLEKDSPEKDSFEKDSFEKDSSEKD